MVMILATLLYISSLAVLGFAAIFSSYMVFTALKYNKKRPAWLIIVFFIFSFIATGGVSMVAAGNFHNFGFTFVCIYIIAGILFAFSERNN